jgi:hypothetical protein
VEDVYDVLAGSDLDPRLRTWVARWLRDLPEQERVKGARDLRAVLREYERRAVDVPKQCAAHRVETSSDA